METYDYEKICKNAIIDYYEDKFDTIINIQDVYVVWSCKTLQNNKMLLSTTIADGMYYELTYNGDKGEMYLDAYKKLDNIVIKEQYFKREV